MNESIMTTEQWQASRKRSNDGRLAQAGGKGFESDLEWTHGRYRQQGRADVTKLPVPTEPMPRSWLRDQTKGGIARILASRQRADYAGTFGTGPLRGRALYMEAKKNTDRVASLQILRDKEKGHGLKIHQLEGLVDGFTHFGAVGVVVWRNGGDRLVFMPDHLQWSFNEFRLGKIRRIYPVDAVQYERAGMDLSLEDWLTPVEAWITKYANVKQT